MSYLLFAGCSPLALSMLARQYHEQPDEDEKGETKSVNFLLEQVKEIVGTLYPSEESGQNNPAAETILTLDTPVTIKTVMQIKELELEQLRRKVEECRANLHQEPQDPEEAEKHVQTDLEQLAKELATIVEKAKLIYPKLSQMAKDALDYLQPFLANSTSVLT